LNLDGGVVNLWVLEIMFFSSVWDVDGKDVRSALGGPEREGRRLVTGEGEGGKKGGIFEIANA
jgi:hypothetical protein